MITRTKIAQRVFDAPLLMAPGKVAAVLVAIGGRIIDGGVVLEGAEPIDHIAFAHGRPSSSLGILGDPLGQRLDRQGASLPFDMVGRVAIIAIEGTLVHKGGWIGSNSGETSYQGIQTQVQRALQSDAVGGVVFEVDSNGGEAAGAFEAAFAIAELSAAKPTIAILTDNANSGGYLLASAARQIVMPKFGSAGSIGVVAVHLDRSAQLQQMGVKATLIHAGAHKVDANPFEALPPEIATKWQAELEQLRQYFAEVIGTFRGDRFAKAQALATEAETFFGDQAVELGLVDAVGDPNEAFGAFVQAINGA